MKSSIRYGGSALAVAAALVTGLVLADDKTQQLDPKLAELFKKAEEACTPGPAHKALEPLVGEWNAEVKMWMAPDAPPMTSKGTSKNTWALKDRYVQQEFNGEFMGKPFHGVSFTGYDNVRQKYRSVWLDDMSTSMVVSEGDAGSENKSFALGGTYACAMTGEKDKAVKQVYRIVSRDKFVFEMHDPGKGENSKTMEITYTRK